jgi:hypothetical protein
MSTEHIIVLLYLSMSILSLLWQGSTLIRLVRDSTLRSRATLPYRGLLRTSVCRVTAAIVYVLVSINALWPRFAVLVFTFVVLTLIQAMWQLNARADLRLAQRLKTTPRRPHTQELDMTDHDPKVGT